MILIRIPRTDRKLFIYVRGDAHQVRWYGPHDRLIQDEEKEEMEFQPGPENGESNSVSVRWLGAATPAVIATDTHSLVLGLGRCRRFGWTGCGPDLGIDEP
jgi:hypothetical protein